MSIQIIEPCSARLRKALAIRNMTQTELCAKAKISKSSLSEWLSGKHEPKQDKTYMLAQALNVDPVWLWGYDVPMETQTKISPDKVELTEGEQMMLHVFRLIPEEQQRVFLEMGRAFANSLKKD